MRDDDLAAELIAEIPDRALELLNEVGRVLNLKKEFGIQLLAVFLSRRIEFGDEAGKTVTTLIVNPAVVDLGQTFRMMRDLCDKKLLELEKLQKVN